MSSHWQKPYRLFARCVRGLEGALSSELESLGFPRHCLIKGRSGVTVEEGSLRRLYYLSYFSRLCNGVFVEAASFPLRDKAAFTDSCADITWPAFIRSNGSFLVESRVSEGSGFIHCGRYASQLVKDGVSHHFGRSLGMPTPSVSFSDPDVKVLLHVGGGEARVLVDAVGGATSARRYRYKPAISDIDPTVAVALLHDIGFASLHTSHSDLNEYERLCTGMSEDGIASVRGNEHQMDAASPCHPAATKLRSPECPLADGSNIASQSSDPCTGFTKLHSPSNSASDKTIAPTDGSVVDLFCGCGTVLIEAAMMAARIAPGSLWSSFAFQKFGIYDDVSFRRLQRYAAGTTLPKDSEAYQSLLGSFVGIESCWEKVEACLYSAERAGVLDLLRVTQSDYLKDGLYTSHRSRRNGERWRYLIAQLPRLKCKFNDVPDHDGGISVDSTCNRKSASGVNSLPPAADRHTKHTRPTQNRKAQRSSSAVSALDPLRYYKLVHNISKFRQRFFEDDAKCVLVAPSLLQLPDLEAAYGGPLRGGRAFVKSGVPSMAYHSHQKDDPNKWF
ncbi:Ribosomal RNA large subunit methyltransferase L [Babesia bigemina]|uniref:Ribosomal RNA large subunit methyltransferase L n=1 Tax=Babesia bigemina TaxID=5866 RepID=A0A061DDF8_BABBI|nr:Ribosomal RNA large subunit methyltransferase L [Babesia bigemina]CDR97359.1 Ribosomal RNA large subunit methyltransferase L [Babesia bigemina]|eukprot:XP_012769545.1 Ribosomal RNA large subunit methyltransferase L [Babesia bigemina]